MNEIKVSSVSSFIELTSNFDQQHVSRWFYRGVDKKDRKLIPGLFRSDISQGFASWKDLESYILKIFLREAKPFHNLQNQEYVELLCLAQHHGLPTRLLDWTTNPLVALFFATEKFSLDQDCAVWCYGVHSTHNCLPESSIVERRISTRDLILFPQHISQRIANQSGCFTVHEHPPSREDFVAFENSDNSFGIFEKIIIPSEFRKEIFVQLYEIGYHYGLIYPGLEGISKRLAFELKEPVNRLSNIEQISRNLDKHDL